MHQWSDQGKVIVDSNLTGRIRTRTMEHLEAKKAMLSLHGLEEEMGMPGLLRVMTKISIDE